MTIHKRLPIFLMTLSLLLLAVFLFLFLQKSYQDELEQLQKETGYIFANAIKGMEGDIMEKILIEKIGQPVDSMTWQSHRNIVTEDTSMLFAFLKDRRLNKENDSISISIQTNHRHQKISDVEGSLSIMIAMDSEEMVQNDSMLRIEHDFKDVMTMVEDKFARNMQQSDLPVQYKVIQLQSDTTDVIDFTFSGTYTDLASGEKYGVQLFGFNQFILQQIWPEMLFSLLLFACITLAFWTVYRSLQQQQKLTALKNDFIQNITHELKTPIATVGVAIEALQDFDGMANPERRKEYLSISKNELGRLSLLVDKVLKMSQFEQKEPVLKLETVDLKVLINNILNSMKIQFEKKQATVDLQMAIPVLLHADPLHLSNVLYNLLDNALKYANGQPVIQILVSASGQQGIIEIKDEGMGIAKADQQRIFEKFYRVPQGNTHNVKGHGLGLSYVASVVKKHGGNILLESQPNQGSHFTLQLPLATPS